MGTRSDRLDRLVAACRDGARRRILAELLAESREYTLDELVTVIVSADEPATGRPTRAARREIRIALHHTHLPKLAASGIVRYDAEQGLVTPTEQFERDRDAIATILDSIPDLGVPVEQ